MNERALLAAFRANHHPDAEPSSVEQALRRSISTYLSTSLSGEVKDVVAELRHAAKTAIDEWYGDEQDDAVLYNRAADHITALSAALAAKDVEIARLTAQVAEMGEALEPFARHIDEMKFDMDNKGNLLPDDHEVGWVYVTCGDFRRARDARRAG